MPQISVHFHQSLARVVIDGLFSLQDLAGGIQKMHAHPDFSADTLDLWDFRGANWQRVREELHGLADDFRHWLNDQPRTRKTAMVFGSEAERTLLQLFYESGDWHGNWAFFTDEEEATRWLKQP